MIINTRYFPNPMLDNDANYLAHMEGVLDSIDEFATMEVSKASTCYHFRIAPSLPKYSQPLLQEVLKLNNLYGMHLVLGKSIRRTGTVSFDITF